MFEINQSESMFFLNIYISADMVTQKMTDLFIRNRKTKTLCTNNGVDNGYVALVTKSCPNFQDPYLKMNILKIQR